MVNLTSLLTGIYAGFSFRNKVTDEPGSDLFFIQMKDLENDYASINPRLTPIRSKGIKNRFYLERGDVLFVAKGSNNFAVEYQLDLPKAIASSAFFVLRCDR